MSILSALRTPEQDKETEEALAENRKVGARQADLQRDAERLHLQVSRERRKLAEAEFSGDAAAVETAQQHLAVLANKLSANEGAQTVAGEKLVEINKRLHLANVAGWLRSARRLANKRTKYANEVTEGLRQYLHGRDKLLEANEQMAAGFPLAGVAPQGSIISRLELDEQIRREILRLTGINELSPDRAPGASTNPFLTIHDLKPLSDEIEAANAYYVKTIEDGAPSAPSIKPGSKEPVPAAADEPSSDAEVAALTSSDPDAALLALPAGQTITAEMAAAMMPRTAPATTIDNRANKDGGADEYAA